MPGPTDMEHPYNNTPKKKKVLLLTKKNRPTKGGQRGLTVVAFPQNAHFGVSTEYASR